MITQAIIASQPITIREVPVPPTAQLVIQAANQARDAAQESANAAATSATNASNSAASIRIDSETFASIPPLVNPCFVFVDADETNNNLPTVYFFDGTSLQWLPTVEV